jgi:hypothetical protein
MLRSPKMLGKVPACYLPRNVISNKCGLPQALAA